MVVVVVLRRGLWGGLGEVWMGGRGLTIMHRRLFCGLLRRLTSKSQSKSEATWKGFGLLFSG